MGKKKDGKIPSVSRNVIPELRRFILRRNEDETGTSGTGVVAAGVMFTSGHCVMEWTTTVKSIGVYLSIADVEAIHGHGGKTVVEWV
jgi:hypothetical protein